MSFRLKINLLMLFVFALIAACKVQNPVSKVTTPEIAPEDSDFELIVLEPGFDSWYMQKLAPEFDRSIEYFRYWNNQYVLEWNNSSAISRHFGTPINFDPNENYPREIEHKLYYYFQYVEDVLRIPILKGRTRPNR